MWYRFFRGTTRYLDPEWVHQATLYALQHPSLSFCYRQSLEAYHTPCSRMGLSFTHPVGLAAGLDKNGVAIPAWFAMGFSFVEVGTVTPKAQAGQARPRLFRFDTEQALINRMGFNNAGVLALCERIRLIPKRSGPIGINLGKQNSTPLAEAHYDYQRGFEVAAPCADYLTINISSPNTSDLRDLQYAHYLEPLLKSLKHLQKTYQQQTDRYIPLVVKISPDLEESHLSVILKILLEQGIDGVIATNTTIQRPLGFDTLLNTHTGGLSGQPLSALATAILGAIVSQVGQHMTVIASGGLMTSEDVQARLALGAHLVQLYTGFIWKGPSLIRESVITLWKSAHEKTYSA